MSKENNCKGGSCEQPAWHNDGFAYVRSNSIFVAHYKNGAWDEGKLQESNDLSIPVGSSCLHYGQQCFEGMKAYRDTKGDVLLFRPDLNAKRLQESCKKILLPEVSYELFLKAVKTMIFDNKEFVPPHGKGGTLYIRPMVIGIGNDIRVKPAEEALFVVFGMPVGAYFKNGMAPIKVSVTEYDRAAPNGTGAQKVGGNYAGSLQAHEEAAKEGFDDCIYLDPSTHTKIEEVGSANFYGITKDGVFVTPKSNSILPSITRQSLVYLAQNEFGMKVEERDVFIDKIDEFVEAGACGTAAVITPIGSVSYKGNVHTFGDGGVGEVSKKLYDRLVGIQFGDLDAPEGWVVKFGWND